MEGNNIKNVPNLVLKLYFYVLFYSRHYTCVQYISVHDDTGSFSQGSRVPAVGVYVYGDISTSLNSQISILEVNTIYSCMSVLL